MTTGKSTATPSERLAEASAVCLIHYHEVGLKGRNRSHFEKILLKNLALRLASLNLAALNRGEERAASEVQRISGRLLVRFASLEEAFAAAPELADIPGVVRVSIGYRLRQDLGLVNARALELVARHEPFDSFKVAARRANTDFNINSMELNCLIGEALSNALPDKKVQMTNPDVCLHVEMIQGAAYVYADTQKGIGGLPLGSAGNVVCLLSTGIDSPVAAWRLMKRGAEVIGLHFSGRPETSGSSEYLVQRIAERLEPYGGLKKLVIVPFGSFQRQIAELVPPALRVIFYRRLMFATAELVAKRERAKALVTGESLGQVASQTLDNIRATDAVCTLPVFRPLIGSDKLEIIEQAQKIKTFVFSTETQEDCCTLFMPRNPETHARLAEVESIWAGLPVERWLAEIADGLEQGWESGD
ncbi:MAG: tRNA 4-thiouridine(8) synthase ThiI [Coriobacteriia bacterium]|nr:tRNA 4-thiouridine(8) synthase ThiI [Coriobacteriia bacterium]